MTQPNLPLPRQSGDLCHWGNLAQSGPAYSIAAAAELDTAPLLVITNDSATAARLKEELIFFLGNQSSINVQQMPDWEILPYDTFSPHQDIISQRLATLYHLPQATNTILIVAANTLLHRICPQSYLLGNCLYLKPEDSFIIEERRLLFQQAGYRYVDTVMEHGEFSIKGSIVNIFPMGAEQPYRIDLFDDEIETLRTFDPETQLSTGTVDSIQLLPGHEFPINKPAIERFRARFRETFDVNHRDCPIYQDIGQGIVSPGIEYYLPLFFENTSTLFDYLPQETRILGWDNLSGAVERCLCDLHQRYENRRVDLTHPLLPPAAVMMPAPEFFSALKSFRRITLHESMLKEKVGRTNLVRHDLPMLMLNAKLDDPLAAFRKFIDEVKHILIVAESAGRREVLLELLNQNNINPSNCTDWKEFITKKPPLAISVGLLEHGLHLIDHNLAIIPESLLLGQRVMQRRRRKGETQQNADQIIRNLTELRIGAPVVHIDHGVGRYQGLETLNTDGQTTEFLTLEYANEAKLYVPVSSLHLISRYTGADDKLAPLHRLGSEQWAKARQKAAEKARDVAAELLDIYARREARKGFSFEKPEQNYLAFAASFPFEETPDQQQTIEAVIQDMCAPKPMDRLVCGDVGFGKTEVAMRASFLAAQNGKQTAILVPTTLLAQQHYESFRDRFADWPVEIDVISRFRSQKEIDHLKQKLSTGILDIIIGTHKILQGNLEFKNLGLLIIDEEHRFGVRHKEKLKSLRAEVDILTLTATPIPRTLNMAMSGIRDLSIIATPPARRLSVQTFVRQHDMPLVKEAILRELLRGGQVYYLHNEVESIERVGNELQQLIPEARVITGHGQMRESRLEQVMSDFYHKRFNVLVCTTIIETGIDIPNANTIIISRADKFGMAQLHQLRGRVGRSHHQAYAYLLTPPQKNITADASKRLEAISEAQDLGAGFMLASNDMEIRGAGELLGEGQSGQIQSVGFTLYTDMLEQAVKSIRNGEVPNPNQPIQYGTELNLRIPALLPDDYIHDIHSRLILYKRIAGATSDQELKNLQIELIDRFGLLPDPTKYLFRQTELKLKAQILGIRKLDAGQSEGRIEFEEQTKINPLTMIQLIQSNPKQFRLEGSKILKYTKPMETPDQRFQVTEKLLEHLTEAAD